jgi:hypothetical protein
MYIAALGQSRRHGVTRLRKAFHTNYRQKMFNSQDPRRAASGMSSDMISALPDDE